MIPQNWEASVESGALSGPLFVVAVLALVGGGIGTVASGRFRFRALLLLGAAVWPLPNHPFLGPVVLKLSYGHGVHASDLLSVVAAGLAVLRPRRRSHR